MTEQQVELGLGFGQDFGVQVAARAVQDGLRPGIQLHRWWPWVDPTLRCCWVQRWLLAPGVRERYLLPGADLDVTVRELVADEPRHALWLPFEEYKTQQLRGVIPPDIASWVLLTEADQLAPGLKLLRLQESPYPDSGDWVTLLMRYTEGAGWRLLNFNRTIPRPGWPPILRELA